VQKTFVEKDHLSYFCYQRPPFGDKPGLFYKNGGVLSLSGPALNELLRSVLDKGAPFRFRAKGFSMSPFIKDGDIVTVSRLSGASPGLGDVVAFLHPGTEKLVIHRIVGKNSKSYIIKGDNMSQGDGPVTEADIMGRVIRVERNGKKVFLGLGPEKFLIAFLTRSGLFLHFLIPVWRRVRPIFR